jgi:hypothetical protein
MAGAVNRGGSNHRPLVKNRTKDPSYDLHQCEQLWLAPQVRGMLCQCSVPPRKLVKARTDHWLGRPPIERSDSFQPPVKYAGQCRFESLCVMMTRNDAVLARRFIKL